VAHAYERLLRVTVGLGLDLASIMFSAVFNGPACVAWYCNGLEHWTSNSKVWSFHCQVTTLGKLFIHVPLTPSSMNSFALLVCVGVYVVVYRLSVVTTQYHTSAVDHIKNLVYYV